jgi:uncharacterized damage-inducible protein DinB
MTLAEALLPEFDQEMKTTRSLLERVPAAKAAWKPHVKSYTLGDLSMHLVNTIEWLTTTLTTREFDAAPPGGPRWEPRSFQSTKALLAEHDANVKAARQAIVETSDAEFALTWSLLQGGRAILTMPRDHCVRLFVMNHHVHHRGQLSVYLRMCDVKLPNIYGPTADTPM